MAKGNRGEWSEFYTFLKLLDEKRLDAADDDLQKIADVFFPVLKIIRNESVGQTDYEFPQEGSVRILQAGSEIALVDISDLKTKVAEIFRTIRNSPDTTFEIPTADELMTRLHATRLSAGNGRKEDITLKIHDHRTGTDPEIGYSIKSMLGSPATLLNPSRATNFIYKISNLDRKLMRKINAIDTTSKVRDRLSAITDAGGTFTFDGVSSDTFTANLRRVDTVLPEIVARPLLAFYLGRGSSLSDLVTGMTEDELNVRTFPLPRTDFEIKIKSLLHNVALGMVPDSEWDGKLLAHGGYIIVRDDGEIVCYHIYNADAFKGYLYRNTRFDTPSTTRYEAAKIYEENGEMFIKLTLQIRFIK